MTFNDVDFIELVSSLQVNDLIYLASFNGWSKNCVFSNPDDAPACNIAKLTLFSNFQHAGDWFRPPEGHITHSSGFQLSDVKKQSMVRCPKSSKDITKSLSVDFWSNIYAAIRTSLFLKRRSPAGKILENGMILDLNPFLGTAMVAALKGGFSYVGIETNWKEYAALKDPLQLLLSKSFSDKELASMAKLPDYVGLWKLQRRRRKKKLNLFVYSSSESSGKGRGTKRKKVELKKAKGLVAKYRAREVRGGERAKEKQTKNVSSAPFSRYLTKRKKTAAEKHVSIDDADDDDGEEKEEEEEEVTGSESGAQEISKSY